MADVSIEGMSKIIIKIDGIMNMVPVRAAMLAAGEHIKGVVAQYPPQRRLTRTSVYGSPFRSARQRRWFFAALRSGSIDVPYRRGGKNSQTLGRRWTVSASNSGKTVTVGNNASYGPFVQGNEQSLFHKTMGWQTIDDVIEQERDHVVEMVHEAIERALK